MKMVYTEADMQSLRDMAYDRARDRRLQIVTDFIRRGFSAQAAVDEAIKVCAFIENEPSAKVVAASKKRGRPAKKSAVVAPTKKKGKRKYTKKSAFWSK